MSVLLLDIGHSAGALPNTTPVPARYGSWFPAPHTAAPIAAVENGGTTPVADGVLIEWGAAGQPDVEYRIERAPTAQGPWTEIARVKEPRYYVSDPSGSVWHYRITPIVRGKVGASITLEGASKQAPSVAELVAQQTALDAESQARTQGDFQTALAAAADAQSKADAALAAATTQTEALAAEVGEIVNAPEWDANRDYIVGWLVRHNGSLYRAKTATTGQAPDQYPTAWEHIGQYSSVAGVAAAALSKATINTTALSAEVTRINAMIARMPVGSGNVAAEAALVVEQTARLQGDADNAAAITAEANRINGILARVPSGGGQFATEASVVDERHARVAGDAANASALQSVNAALADKASASIVQSMNVRVNDLEGTGHNSNLLTNATFNSGVNGWTKSQKDSAWGTLTVDMAGDNWHPPGMHTLGIKCQDSTLNSQQYVDIKSSQVAVIPGKRYLASCHIANHRCTSRLYIFWLNAEKMLVSAEQTPLLMRKSGGQSLAGWHHASTYGTAPANAAYAQLTVRFIGDGGADPYGFMIRPMLEQAGEHQTSPSPWNSGGMETSAEYTMALSANGLVGGLRMGNNGQTIDAAFMANTFRVVAPSDAHNGLELKDGHLRVWRNTVQRMIGNGFGVGNELVDYFGPNVGAANASKTNAVMWMDTSGNAGFNGTVAAAKIIGGLQSYTPINWTGNVDLIQSKPANARWVPHPNWCAVTTFGLPAPPANEEHVPLINLMIGLSDRAGALHVLIERWFNGVWQPYWQRSGNTSTAYMGQNQILSGFVYEQSLAFQITHPKISTDVQFRLSVRCLEAAASFPGSGPVYHHTAVTSVTGTVIGLR